MKIKEFFKEIKKEFKESALLNINREPPKKAIYAIDFWDEIKIILGGKIYLLDKKKLEKLLVDSKALLLIKKYKG